MTTTFPMLAQRTETTQSSAIRDLLKLTADAQTISLAGGLPATELIPSGRIAAAAEIVLRSPTAVQYGETPGWRELRDVIAQRESSASNRHVDAEHVVVTHGSQQALTLLAQVLFDPGSVVVVDEPAYTGALQVFSLAGATIRAVPTTDQGMDTIELERLLQDGLRPRVVHTVANFHNPRGVTMSEAGRQHLARLADHYGFWVIEDDPYGEIWFGTLPPLPIASYSDRVIKLGSASKILAPALRTGWMVAPTHVCNAVELVKQAADLCGSSLTQQITCELLGDTAWLDTHLSGLRSEYARRALALSSELSSTFAENVVASTPDGGLFTWIRFVDGTDSSDLLRFALTEGVGFVFADSLECAHSARLCFATSAPEVLAEAVTRLSRAHRRCGGISA